MTSKLVVNTIEADTGISSVSFGSSISLSSTSKFHFSAAGIDIGADTNINRPASGVLAFNINSSEKARIDSSGRVLIGTTSATTLADELVLATSGDCGITIMSGTAHNGRLYFSDSGQEGDGFVDYDHQYGNLKLGTRDTTRFTIDSAGRVKIGTGTEGNSSADNLTVEDSGESGITVRSGTSNGGHIYFSDATSGTAEYQGLVSYQHNGDFMKFGTAATERLRIDSSGNVNFGANKAVSLPSGTGIQVYNSSTPRIKLVNDTTGNAAGDGLQIYVTGSSAIFDHKENAEMRFYTNATERLRIDAGGGMQLGTSTATASKLTVYGANDAAAIFQGSGTGTGAANGLLVGNNGGTTGLLWNYENGNTLIATNNIERLRISSNGQLQISPAGAVKMSFYHDSGSSLNHIVSNNGNEIKVSSGNGDSNGIEFWDYTGTNKRCQIDGHGIKFNTDTAEANALDDYEEGTYVPSTNTGLTLNSGYNTLSYIKIGRCCTIRGLFFPNNNPSGGHTMTISLPFASYNYTGSGASIAGAGGSGAMYRSISGADAGVAVYISDNVNYAQFYKNGSNGGAWSPVYNNDWNSGMEIYIDVTYFTV